MSGPRASVIIPAAGAGRRFREAAPGRPAEPPISGPAAPATKVFAPLAGRPVLAHTLDAFAAVPAVAEIVVALPADHVDRARDAFARASAGGPRLVFVAGGADRTESVALALEAADPAAELVAVHDAVRPLIRRAVIEEALRVALERGAAVVGRPLDHTVKSVDGERRVIETVPRRSLWLVQTPQVFRREVLARAYARRASVVGAITDDAQLVEALGLEVVMVPGDAANLKITTPEDLRLCEALLAAGWPFEGPGGPP